jgi:hypothetical protein
MPFIGKQPLVGAYSKLDALVASATATYNLTLGGSAYYPQSANHLLVSVNGVIQAPGNAFTISANQIIFSSALTSGDSINFIIALGDVLGIGVPSDGTVTSAKLDTNIAIAGNLTVDTNTLYVDSTNNRVGIGTTSPDALLTVNTIASFGDGAVGTPSIAHKGDLNTGIWFPAADTIAFSEGGAEAMRIDSSGNVGIGTSSPGTILDVNGAVTLRATGGEGGEIRFNNGANNATAMFIDVDNNNATRIYNALATNTIFYTNSSERMRIDSSGNVGIGTSSVLASTKLDVRGAISAYDGGTQEVRLNTDGNIEISRTDGVPFIDFKSSTAEDYDCRIQQISNGLTFQTGGNGTASERMRIDSSGNVGINTSSPGAKLHVNGSNIIGDFNASGTYTSSNVGTSFGWNFSGGGRESMVMNNDTSGGGFSFHQRTGASSETRIMRVAGTGIYNTTTATAANVNIDSGNTLQRSTSALKYKTDIRDLSYIDINKFRPVIYKSKCENDDKTLDHFGIIADEVDAAGIKELIIYNENKEVEGFQYERLTVVLLKAIQEQQTIINDLKARIETIETK